MIDRLRPTEQARIEQRRASPDAARADDRRRNEEAAYWSRVWRAVMLSPRVEVCEALLRGESVPLDRLDADWARRFEKRSS